MGMAREKTYKEYFYTYLLSFKRMLSIYSIFTLELRGHIYNEHEFHDSFNSALKISLLGKGVR